MFRSIDYSHTSPKRCSGGSPVQMIQRFLATAALAVVTPILASAACPAGLTGDTYFVKQKVAFRFLVSQFGTNSLGPSGNGSLTTTIGVFVGLPGGLLDVTFTRADLRGSSGPLDVVRRVPGSGRWMVAPDCASGMLWINFDRKNYTINIVISPTGEITVAPNPPVNPQVPGVGMPNPAFVALKGIMAYDENGNEVDATFSIGPPMTCPPIGNPLNLLNGMTYNFTGISNDATFDADGNFYWGVDEGTFTGVFNGGYAGTLIINNRMITFPGINASPRDGSPVDIPYMPRYTTYGRYIIYPDCSGGELLFNDQNRPRQYEFIFADPAFRTIWYVSDYETLGNTYFLGFRFDGPFYFPFNGIATKQ